MHTAICKPGNATPKPPKWSMLSPSSFCQRTGGECEGTLLHGRRYRWGYGALTAGREAVIHISMIRLWPKCLA